MELYNIFDSDNHLQPEYKRTNFENLHDWDFGWAILEPINIAASSDEDRELSKRFSPGQKALYFFWYLDGEVTNGGFVQFYYNNYRHYLPAIKEGLKLIGDQELIELINKVDNQYIINKGFFDKQISRNTWEPLYELESFKIFDDEYYKIHDHTMALIEKYARAHPEEFVILI